jgi:hypothetical protein
MNTYPILLISGAPSTGKTTFGNWLQETKSFIHVDIEKTQCIPTPGLLNGWSQAQGVVLTWGFFPGDAELGIIALLKSRGVSVWWFTAESDIAREDFVRRGSDVKLFDFQMPAIEREWEKIEKLFSPNTIPTLSREGHMTCELIYRTKMTNLGRADNLESKPTSKTTEAELSD